MSCSPSLEREQSEHVLITATPAAGRWDQSIDLCGLMRVAGSKVNRIRLTPGKGRPWLWGRHNSSPQCPRLFRDA